jgi:hypothetical protein
MTRRLTLVRSAAAVAIGAILAAVLAGVPAHAAPPETAATGSDVYTAPPVPSQVSTAGAAHRRGDLASPEDCCSVPVSISPTVDVEYAIPGGYYTCPDYTLCAGVWDPYWGLWAIFKLFYCNTYSLYEWNSTLGFYLDKQTPGTQSYFYDQNMHAQVWLVAGQNPTQHSFDWSPYWYIKNC